MVEDAIDLSGSPPNVNPVRIARSDLAETVRKFKRRSRGRSPAVAVTGAAGTDASRIDGFEQLARRQEDARPAAHTGCRWEDYPAEESASDVPEQEADRNVFDRLVDAR